MSRRPPAPSVRLASALAVAACLVGTGCQPGEAPDGAADGAAGGASRVELVEAPDRGAASVAAVLDLPLGAVTTGHAEDGTLFQAEVTLPADALAPAFRTETTDATDGDRLTVHLGLGGEVASPRDLRALGDGFAWRLLFADRAPLDLDVRLGVTDAELDLTGIPVERLAVRAGAGTTTLRFTAPNPAPQSEIDVEAGVRSFTAEGLGWARFRRFSFEGGVGRFRLDFTGGALLPAAEASLAVGVGSLDVVLPAGHPTVLLLPEGGLAQVRPPDGFVVAGPGRYASPGADADPDAFVVRLRAGPGRVRFTVR